MSHEAKARELESEAEKKLKSFSWWGDGKEKYEAAGEIYTRAANSWILAKKTSLPVTRSYKPRAVI